MPAVHGKGGMVYLQGSGAAATKLGLATGWTFNIDRDLSESNVLGDTWKTNLLGLMGWKGKIDGRLDTTETSPFDAAVATGTKAIYLYPVATSNTQYYYGLCWPRLTVNEVLKDVVSFTLDFEGDGQLAKN